MKEVVVTRIKGTVQLPLPRCLEKLVPCEVDLEISVPIDIIHVLSAVVGGACALSVEEMERMLDLVDKVMKDSTTP